MRHGASSGKISSVTSEAEIELMMMVSTASMKNRLVPAQERKRMRGGPIASTSGPVPPALGPQIRAGLVGGHHAEEQHHRKHRKGQHGDFVIALGAIDGQQRLVGRYAEGVRRNFEYQRQHAQPGAAQQQALDHQARQLAVGFPAFGQTDVAIEEEHRVSELLNQGASVQACNRATISQARAGLQGHAGEPAGNY